MAMEELTPAEPLSNPVPDRPLFAAEYPSDPSLNRLLQAFVDGRYDVIHREAAAVAKGAGDEAVSSAALELLARTKPDPLQVRIIGVAVTLLAVLVTWAYTNH